LHATESYCPLVLFLHGGWFYVSAVLQSSGADRLLQTLHVCSGCQIEEMVDELDLPRQIYFLVP